MISDEAALAILKAKMETLDVTCVRHKKTQMVSFLGTVWCPNCVVGRP